MIKGMSKNFILIVILALLSGTIIAQDRSTRDVDDYLEKYLTRAPIPGFSIVIVEDQEVKFLKGYGVAQDGHTRPMTPSTTLAIGSLARGFTGMAVMQLVEQGLLDLDEPIITYLPWFTTATKEFSDQITLRMCLSNTTGIPPQYDSMPDLDSDNNPEAFVRSLQSEFIKRLPGMSHEFSDEGYVIAGLIISEVTGMSYPDYVQRHILNPLSMIHTHPSKKHIDKHQPIYGHEMGLTECVPAVDGITDANYIAAGSEFYSSAADLGHYLLALLNGGNYKNQSVLSASGVEELFKSNTSFQGLGTMVGGNGIDIQYALGWMGMTIEDRDIMIHPGSNGNVAAIMGINRDKNQAFAMLFNADVNRFDRYEYPGMEHIVNNVIHIFNNEDTTDFGIVRVIPNDDDYVLPQKKWPKYLGKYYSFGRPNPFFKDMNIEVLIGEGGELELIARQGKVFKGHYRLQFTNESRAILRNISFPREIQFSLYPGGSIGGLFMFGSEFKKRDESTVRRYVDVASSHDHLSLRLPRTSIYKWSQNVLTSQFENLENTSLQLSIVDLQSLKFEEYLDQELSDLSILTKGIINKKVHRKGIWKEQTVIVRENDNTTQCTFAFYQDPVSQKQMQLTLRHPWGRYSTEVQEVLAQIKESVVLE